MGAINSVQERFVQRLPIFLLSKESTQNY